MFFMIVGLWLVGWLVDGDLAISLMLLLHGDLRLEINTEWWECSLDFLQTSLIFCQRNVTGKCRARG
jgi:hypothetical protein